MAVTKALAMSPAPLCSVTASTICASVMSRLSSRAINVRQRPFCSHSAQTVLAALPAIQRPLFHAHHVAPPGDAPLLLLSLVPGLDGLEKLQKKLPTTALALQSNIITVRYHYRGNPMVFSKDLEFE